MSNINKIRTPEQLIREKMTDYLIDNTVPTLGDALILDYLVSAGAVDLQALANEIGESEWIDWFQYVKDLKIKEAQRWKTE